MIRAAMMVVVAGLLAGCAASGRQVTAAQTAPFKEGVTTIDEVVAALGAPNRTTTMPDGSQSIIYSYAQAQARPETFIPIIGPLVGGADVRSNMVMLTFDKVGVLKTKMSSSSQHGSGLGAAAGAPMSRVPDEPKQAP